MSLSFRPGGELFCLPKTRKQHSVWSLSTKTLQNLKNPKAKNPKGTPCILSRRKQRRFIVSTRTLPSPPTRWWPCPSCARSAPASAPTKGPSTCCCCSCRRRRGSPSWNRMERRYRVQVTAFGWYHPRLALREMDFGG